MLSYDLLMESKDRGYQLGNNKDQTPTTGSAFDKAQQLLQGEITDRVSHHTSGAPFRQVDTGGQTSEETASGESRSEQ